jgi:hypothetical protein
MTESTASFFTEPDKLRASLYAHLQGAYVVTGNGQFRASLLRIELSRSCLLGVEEFLPRIAFMRPAEGLVVVLLPGHREALQTWAGAGLLGGEILTISAPASAHGRSEGYCRSAGICCSATHLLRTGRLLLGRTFTIPPGVVRWRPASKQLNALTALFGAAMRVTGSRLSAPANREAASGLEQELIAALVECLSVVPDLSDRRGEIDASLMSRFEEFLLQHRDVRPSVEEVAAHLGVSLYVLRGCCHEQLGIPPARYIRLRQMQRWHEGRSQRGERVPAVRV